MLLHGLAANRHGFHFPGRWPKVTKSSLEKQRRYRVCATDYVCQQIEKRMKRRIGYKDTGVDWRLALEDYAKHLGVIKKPKAGRIVRARLCR